MGLVLASENQSWWTRLNSAYTKFTGASVTIQDVSSGDLASAVSINNFLNALGDLKSKNYSRDIDWSNFNAESLKNPGDLIQMITVNNITTTLTRLEDQCAHNAVYGDYGDNSRKSHRGNYSDYSDYSDCSQKDQSSFQTENSGYADSTTRSQSCQDTCPNTSHNKNTT